MTVRVGLPGPADERPAREDAARELRMAVVDPGIDHGDLHRRERRLGGPVAPGAVLREVPLVSRERLGVAERDGERGREERRDEHAEKGLRHVWRIGCETPGESPCPGAQRMR